MIKNLINLLFPKVCYACNNLLADQETHLCTNCRHELPITNYHITQSPSITKIFYGRVKIEQATALLKFSKKGKVQRLLHNLKYRGHEPISGMLGSWLGHELKSIASYQNIDLVIPVPLHKRKLRKRGYNQVTQFGEKIAKAINAEYNDTILVKISNTKTQVFKKRVARWINNQEIFSLQNKDLIAGKHILLVDDIITTGATIEACTSILQKAGNVKISVAAMAIAD